MKYIIYKIQIKDYIYIGSTQNFTIRKAQHKSKCINGNEFLVYKTIRENGGWDCCTMVPVKEIEVESKIQARIAEEEVRIEYNAQMNSIRAYITEDERIEFNQQRQQTPEYKEYRKEYNKQYNQTEKHKQYDRHRKQTPEYKEYMKEYSKQYRLAKKAKLVESPEIKVEA